MRSFLFPGLTAGSKRGQALFDHAVREARQPFWYRECEVPDTIDGRFAMLATVSALVIVRLEAGGEAGKTASAALTERFIEAMDAEHRELGLNDPGLGRKVRKLVGALGRRVDSWRSATAGKSDWSETTLSSVYGDRVADPPAVKRASDWLSQYWARLKRTPDRQLYDGDL
jgi:cytochrome b pre-mRNA-processing protein 3